MCVFVLGSYINANSLMVKQLPAVGESVRAASLWTEHGGKGLNLAVGLHRLGLLAHTLLAIGRDAPGDALLRFLRAEGVDTRLIKQVDVPSGFGVGLVSASGDNVIAVYPGANAQMTAADVRAAGESLARCRLACAQFEIPDAPILEAFQLARQYGIQTLLSPSPLRVFDPALLALTDILVLNEPEAVALFGIGVTHDLSAAFWIQLLPSLGWQGKLLVVTLADQGCVALEAGGAVLHEPAWMVLPCDPTGAGDAFTAGLAFTLLANYPLKAALKFANACGALVASCPGVLAALPSCPQVLAFMAGQQAVGSFSG